MVRCLIEPRDNFYIYFHVSMICCYDILLFCFNKQAESVFSGNVARHIDESHTSSVDVGGFHPFYRPRRPLGRVEV
jgi:hypothetical protein